MDAFVNAMNKAEIAIGPNEVIRITDINKAKRFISEFEKAKLHLGTDLYNGYCSGDCRIRIVDDKHLAIFALDNNSEYRFKFLSMILYCPMFHDNSSPVIILESDNDSVDADNISLEDDYHGGKYYEGICFVKESHRIIYDPKEIYEFYQKCDYEEGFVVPEHFGVCNFLNKNIFACINVQGLEYWRFNQFLRSASKYDGHQIEISLREAKKAEHRE